MYKITDLGTLSPDGTDTRAASINNQGQIVGRSRTAGNTASSGYIWENGTITALPLTGPVNGGTPVTLPGRGGLSRSINAAGMIVGAGDETAGPTDRALLWTLLGLGLVGVLIATALFAGLNRPGSGSTAFGESNAKTAIQNYLTALSDGDTETIARNTLCGMYDGIKDRRSDMALARLASDAFRKQFARADVTSIDKIVLQTFAKASGVDLSRF
jgi:probable HAF family extracellular repeat protein